MSSNWASAGPLTWFPTFLPLTCRDTDLMMTVRRLEHLVKKRLRELRSLTPGEVLWSISCDLSSLQEGLQD